MVIYTTRPAALAKDYNITFSLFNCRPDNSFNYYIKRGRAIFFIKIIFLFIICIYSYYLFLKIYYSGIPSLFPCQCYFYYNFKYIIMPFKSIKYAQYVELNKKCINISWELLDKICEDTAF